MAETLTAKRAGESGVGQRRGRGSGSVGAELKRLRERAERLRLEQEAAVLQAQLRGLDLANLLVLSESYPGMPAGYGRIVGNDWRADDPDYRAADLSLDMPGDRKGGQDRILFQSETDLAAIRGTGRFLCHYVAPAVGLLRGLTNYVVGTSWGYEASLVDKTQTQQNEPLLAAVNDWLAEFLDANDWVGGLDREAYRRLVRDGEPFLWLKPGERGVPAIRHIEPSWVVEPANPRAIEEWLAGCYPESIANPSSWRFGVHTAADDPETVWGYHVVRDGVGHNWDYIRADRMEHIKAATDRNVKRGVSEFWPVRERLLQGDKVFRNVAEGAAVQAAIAYVRQFEQGTRASDIVGINVVGSIADGTGREVDQHHLGPGTVLNARKFTYEPGPMGSQRNPNLLLAGDAVLRLAAVRWNAPEWMGNGNASQTNFASSLVAENPFVKACEAEQHKLKRSFYQLIWKAAKMAVIAGRFAKYGVRHYEQLEELIEIGITPTPVEREVQNERVLRDEKLIGMGVKSRRTTAAEYGLDYDQEQAHIKDEPKPVAVDAGLSGQVVGRPDEVRSQESSARRAIEFKRSVSGDGKTSLLEVRSVYP